jgi:hypothetical protein
MRLIAWEPDWWWWYDMEQLVQGSLGVVGHEDFHLTLGKILDVFIEGTGFLAVGHGSAAGYFVLFPSK